MSTSSVHRSAAPRGILVVCTSVEIARALARQTGGGKWRHYGLFRGWSGDLQGIPVVVVVAEPNEESVYIAVRQMVPLVAPRALLYLSEAVATAEDLRAGDVALIGEARRCYCPSVVTDNLFSAQVNGQFPAPPVYDPGDESGLAFPDDNVRRFVLDAPPLSFDTLLTGSAAQVLNRAEHPDVLQATVATLAIGSAVVAGWQGRTAEYLRSRYRIDAVAPGAYGALNASLHTGVAAAGLVIIAAGRGSDTACEYRHSRSRYLSAAAGMTAILIRQFAGESVIVTNQAPS